MISCMQFEYLQFMLSPLLPQLSSCHGSCYTVCFKGKLHKQTLNGAWFWSVLIFGVPSAASGIDLYFPLTPLNSVKSEVRDPKNYKINTEY